MFPSTLQAGGCGFSGNFHDPFSRWKLYVILSVVDVDSVSKMAHVNFQWLLSWLLHK